MVTAVDICNLALAHIGDTAEVTAISPSDGSLQADLCARYYPMARESLLESAMWNFSTKRAVLALNVFDDADATSDTTSWLYAYELPGDYMRSISVLPEDATSDYVGTSIDPNWVCQPWTALPVNNVQTYAIEVGEADELLLYTNIEDATLRYTAYITNPQVFPPLFTEALSWHLASMLAGPIIKGTEGAQVGMRAAQMAEKVLAKAMASDASQRRIRIPHVPSWIAGR